MNSFFRKLHWLIRRSGKEAELREEIEFHLAEETDQRQADGMTVGEATKFATAAGALACTGFGAQPSLPTREAVEKLMAKRKS